MKTGFEVVVLDFDKIYIMVRKHRALLLKNGGFPIFSYNFAYSLITTHSFRIIIILHTNELQDISESSWFSFETVFL